MKKLLFLIIALISFVGCQKEYKPDKLLEQEAYKFFVAGHPSGGAGVNNAGLHPQFKEKFNYLNLISELEFGFFLGDIVSPNPIEQDWDEVDLDLTLLNMPVYFAVGNHDMENRSLYESRYGDTYYHFIFENDLFVVLDPNLNNWNISGEQLNFLTKTIVDNQNTVDNIFIFFHQLLWRESDNIYSQINLNSLAHRDDDINFWIEVEPLVNGLNNDVVFFAGDLGAGSWSDNFMYDHYDNISLVATGMGDGDGDNFIVISVSSDKKITYDLICLDTIDLECFGELIDYQITF